MPSDFDPYYEWLGIPPKDQPPNHYRLLGLDAFEANADVIDNAAEQRMLLLRNRQGGSRGEVTQKLLNEITAARGALLDEKKKQAYDAELKRKVDAQAAASAIRKAPPPVAAPPAAPPPVQPPPMKAPPPPLAPRDENPLASLQSTGERKPGAAARKLKASNKRLQFMLMGLGLVMLLLVGGIGVVAARFLSGNKEVAAKPEENPKEKDKVPPPVAPVPTPTPEKPAATETDTGKKPAPPVTTTPTPSTTTPPSTTPKVPLPTSTKYRPVDLLARIDLTRDAAAGDWTLADGVLASPADAGPARLVLPYTPPSQYILDLDVERGAGVDSLAVGLVVGGRACYHFFDSHPKSGSLSGLATQLDKTETTGEPLHRGVVLRPGKKTRLQLVVQAESVSVLVNGQMLHQWQGDPLKLSLGLDGAGARPDPPNRGLYLATQSTEIRCSRIVLTPLAAPRDAEIVESKPDEPAPETPAPVTPMPEVIPVKRVPAPPAAEIAKARGDLQAVFKNELAQAKTADMKLAVVQHMFQLAAEEPAGSATRYALFDHARELAAGTGHIGVAFQAIDELSAAFEIDALPLRQQSFTQGIAFNVPLPVRRENVMAGFALVDADIEHDEYASAAKALNDMSDALRLLKDKDLAQAAAERRKRGSDLFAEFKRVQGYKDKLKTTPDDAEAHLALGRFFCFAKNDWKQGLAHLAQGSDEKLKTLATQDAAQPTAAKDQVALADGWYAVAEAAPAKDKTGPQARAAHWYRAALPEATGLEKAKIERRLQDLPAAPTAAVSPAFGEPPVMKEPPLELP